MKPDSPIPVIRPTLKRVKKLENGEGVIYSLDRRSILNIVNRKAKKPNAARPRVSEK